MRLLAYDDDDRWLTEALECDPAVMKYLGGPRTKGDIPGVHQKRLKAVADGHWYFKIVPEDSDDAIGTIGIWRVPWKGGEISEMGWMLLPSFQGRGLGSQAAGMVLKRAADERRFTLIHAFPSVLNGASNAICRRLGFTKLEACDLEYAGRPLRCNHWKIDVWPTKPG